MSVDHNRSHGTEDDTGRYSPTAGHSSPTVLISVDWHIHYLRWLFMLDTRVQLSVSGLYTSTVLSRDWPSYPPMAYNRPFTTATPTLLRAVRIG